MSIQEFLRELLRRDHGLIRGAPYPVRLDEHGSAIEFEENAIERWWGAYLR
ncbi:MAG TPA: hypothetical protein VFZ91_13650 [Allosphingosinicella sp.]